MRLAFAIVIAALLAACTSAAKEPAFPYFEEEGGRVRDGADLLSPNVEAELTARLNQAQEQYGQAMAIVTVPSLHGMSIEDFSIGYARAWKLGHRDRNDGLLLLVAPDERKVRIEVGVGIEGTFTDPFCQQVLDDVILPAFKAGAFEAGIDSGTNMLIDRMKAYPSLPANDNEVGRVEDAA